MLERRPECWHLMYSAGLRVTPTELRFLKRVGCFDLGPSNVRFLRFCLSDLERSSRSRNSCRACGEIPLSETMCCMFGSPLCGKRLATTSSPRNGGQVTDFRPPSHVSRKVPAPAIFQFSPVGGRDTRH